MDAINAHQIQLALRNRHADESWAYFEELRSRTGYSGDIGYIDAYAVGLWANNRSFISYEIKCTRGDFLSDVEQFASKQAVAIRNSTQFYYVCPHNLLQASEVPELAGLIYINAGGAVVKKVAPVRELKDGCLDVKFTMAMLRAAAGKPPKKTMAWKYLGKEITEEELTKLATDLGTRLNERDIRHLAREEADKQQSRDSQILLKFGELSGMWHDNLNYDTIEAAADKMAKAFKARQSEMGLCRDMRYNVKRMRDLLSEFERLLDEENKDATQTDSQKTGSPGGDAPRGA